jgi:hypothetical protein
MDQFTQLYHSVLSSHTNLSEEDVSYAIPKLIEIYQNQLIPLLHINMNSYIGKLSEKFNKRLDEHIKNQTLVLDEDYWPLHLLNETEKNELIMLERMASIALLNCYNYLKNVKYLGNINNLYLNILSDMCKENNLDFGKYSNILKYNSKNEVGSIINVNHTKYIDLSDLTKANLDTETANKYQKELKILRSK